MLNFVPLAMLRSSVRPAMRALPMLLRSTKEKSLVWGVRGCGCCGLGFINERGNMLPYSEEPGEDMRVEFPIEALVESEVDGVVCGKGVFDMCSVSIFKLFV